MEGQQDFRDLLALFNAHEADFAVAGAHALAYHGVSRYTGDMDILVCPNAENARRILEALSAFGFGSVGLTAENFSVPDRVIQLGVAPVRIDILTSITGVSWEKVAAGQALGKHSDVPVHFIGRNELILNKRGGPECYQAIARQE